MNITLFISVVSGLFFVCALISIAVVLIWWGIHLRKVKKKIPEDLIKEIEEEKLQKKEYKKLKGGENEKEIKEEVKRIREEIRRESSRRGVEEETGDSKYNSNIKGRGRVPILPVKQPSKHKRELKEDWPEFE